MEGFLVRMIYEEKFNNFEWQMVFGKISSGEFFVVGIISSEGWFLKDRPPSRPILPQLRSRGRGDEPNVNQPHLAVSRPAASPDEKMASRDQSVSPCDR